MEPSELRKELARRAPTWKVADKPVDAAPRLGYLPSEDAPTLKQQERIARRQAREKPSGAAPPHPRKHDLRDGDFITPIRDQRECLSCVAFAICAAIEGTLRVQRDDPKLDVDLSEAHLFYCVARRQGRACQGPNAGWTPRAALTACRDQGVPDEECFPYERDDDPPCASPWDWQDGATRISDWRSRSTPAEMKAWIATRGPLIASMSVYEDFELYKGDVYRKETGDLLGGHCVCIVGYDDEQGCWIGKNSWGEDFGEKGFFRIAYGECAIDSTMLGVGAVQPAWQRKLVDLLSRPESRKSFASAPVATLRRAGIAKSDIPREVLETLTDLSYKELELIARVRLSLENAGADAEFLGRVH